jgi:hypothetical protein
VPHGRLNGIWMSYIGLIQAFVEWALPAGEDIGHSATDGFERLPPKYRA